MAKSSTNLFPEGTLFLSVAIPPADGMFHTAFITARRDGRASLHRVDYASMDELMDGLAACATRLAEIEARPPAASPPAGQEADPAQNEPEVAQATQNETTDEDLEITFFDPTDASEPAEEPGVTQESLF